MANNIFNVSSKDSIIQCLENISSSMAEHIKANTNCKYSLWYKYVNHSDLPNKGKRNGPKEKVTKNFLYYLSDAQMLQMEAEGVSFPTAKQSNIGMPKDVYTALGIVKSKNTDYCNYIDVKVANDNLEPYSKNNVVLLLQNLGKVYPWGTAGDYSLSDSSFTSVPSLTEGDHGICTANDTFFSNIRLSVFLNDTIYFLVEESPTGKNTLYILFERNPLYYQITGQNNSSWDKYLQDWDNKIANLENVEEKTAKAIVRQLHEQWKLLLAREMMNYVNNGSQVECPFTSIKGNFEMVPMLFIASHIKRFADSNLKEKYDKDNGLLLAANADALFDKYMITVSEDKELIFSSLIDNDSQLKKDLLLNHNIMKHILNDKRMEYMKEHRTIFEEKEIFRKARGIYIDSDDTDDKAICDERTNTQISHTVKHPQLNYINSINTDSIPFAAEDTYCVVADKKLLLNAPNSAKCILIGCYKSIQHLKWIKGQKKYNVRLGSRIGSQDKKLQNSIDVQILALYYKDDPRKVQYFELGPGEKMNAEQLNALGYPKARSKNMYYVYPLGAEYLGLNLDIARIIQRASGTNSDYVKGMPIYIEEE